MSEKTRDVDSAQELTRKISALNYSKMPSLSDFLSILSVIPKKTQEHSAEEVRTMIENSHIKMMEFDRSIYTMLLLLSGNEAQKAIGIYLLNKQTGIPRSFFSSEIENKVIEHLIGDLYISTTAPYRRYIAVGLTNTDWRAI